MSSSPLERARESCIALNAKEAWLDQNAIDTFVALSDAERIKSLGSMLAESLCSFPIQYSSVEQEVSFIAVCHALDFGSGFRKQLHRFHGLGAWNTVKNGLIRMYEANNDLEAKWMKDVTMDQVESFFLPGFTAWKVDGDKDEISEISNKTLAEDAKLLMNLLGMFHAVILELGNGLLEAGFPLMHQYVIRLLEEEQVSGSLGGGASAVVDGLVRAFPHTFDDRYTYTDGTDVFLYKKAQLVTGELYHRFRKEKALFDFRDANQLTPYVDNVIVATMRKGGAIRIADELTAAIESGQSIPKGSAEEIALRAKSLHAIDLIAKGINEKLRANTSAGESVVAILPCEIGNFLWGVLGKEKTFRAFQRHATPDTCFY